MSFQFLFQTDNLSASLISVGSRRLRVQYKIRFNVRPCERTFLQDMCLECGIQLFCEKNTVKFGKGTGLNKLNVL
jgi:hypothetical protein